MYIAVNAVGVQYTYCNYHVFIGLLIIFLILCTNSGYTMINLALSLDSSTCIQKATEVYFYEPNPTQPESI